MSYFLVLLQRGQAPIVQHTHDGSKTNHCAPSHCKKNGVVSVLAERLNLPNGRTRIISAQNTQKIIASLKGSQFFFSVGPLRVCLNSWTGETTEKQKPWPSRFPYIVARLCIVWVGFSFSKPDALSLKVGKAAPEADLQARFRLVTREKSFKIDAVSDRARTP